MEDDGDQLRRKRKAEAPPPPPAVERAEAEERSVDIAKRAFAAIKQKEWNLLGIALAQMLEDTGDARAAQLFVEYARGDPVAVVANVNAPMLPVPVHYGCIGEAVLVRVYAAKISHGDAPSPAIVAALAAAFPLYFKNTPDDLAELVNAGYHEAAANVLCGICPNAGEKSGDRKTLAQVGTAVMFTTDSTEFCNALLVRFPDALWALICSASHRATDVATRVVELANGGARILPHLYDLAQQYVDSAHPGEQPLVGLFCTKSPECLMNLHRLLEQFPSCSPVVAKLFCGTREDNHRVDWGTICYWLRCLAASEWNTAGAAVLVATAGTNEEKKSDLLRIAIASVRSGRMSDNLLLLHLCRAGLPHQLRYDPLAGVPAALWSLMETVGVHPHHIRSGPPVVTLDIISEMLNYQPVNEAAILRPAMRLHTRAVVLDLMYGGAARWSLPHGMLPVEHYRLHGDRGCDCRAWIATETRKEDSPLSWMRLCGAVEEFVLSTVTAHPFAAYQMARRTGLHLATDNRWVRDALRDIHVVFYHLRWGFAQSAAAREAFMNPPVEYDEKGVPTGFRDAQGNPTGKGVKVGPLFIGTANPAHDDGRRLGIRNSMAHLMPQILAFMRPDEYYG